MIDHVPPKCWLSWQIDFVQRRYKRTGPLFVASLCLCVMFFSFLHVFLCWQFPGIVVIVFRTSRHIRGSESRIFDLVVFFVGLPYGGN